QLGFPIPPPGLPGPFALDSAEAFAEVLGEADIEDVSVPLHADSIEEWSSRVLALAGPLANLVAAMQPDAARELQDRLEQAAQPYLTDAGLAFPGVALLATVRR